MDVVQIADDTACEQSRGWGARGRYIVELFICRIGGVLVGELKEVGYRVRGGKTLQNKKW